MTTEAVVGDSTIIDLGKWCPFCRGRTDRPSPHVRPNEDELVCLDRTTGRWHHLLCLIVADRQEGGAATVRH